ncbi:uncharacterized protein B0H18DRAFT_1065838 [Fomitopsis serialis]|uniref:uncharacterized protein n=1 Tax=Fomitopsis serialis TaxID=139415 RepID=UPI002008D361|nr:uncharacterized protein B0H18DRAFT_1065838 [Neoantrodia serialis]KAH9910866.1 hypothetical protein B0H18DRAFT_1065838 [Neoantrodia serialis]
MEDIYGNRAKERHTRSYVLCCTSLGLRRIEKVEGSTLLEHVLPPTDLRLRLH